MSRRFGRSLWIAGSLATIGALVGVMVALAASGDLDATFSGDGRQTTDFAGNWDDGAYAVAVQSNGKIVAVGERFDPANLSATTRNFAIARYNSTGTLDSTFSGDGKQLTDFGGSDSAWDVAIQSDGKIVVSGQKCNASWVCDIAIARYKTDGTLDTTFSGDGKQMVSFGSGDNGTEGGLAIQADGKIVIAGWMVNASGNNDFAVYRLNPGGTLDTTFSGDGRQNIGFGSGKDDRAEDVLVFGGKIVVVGQTCGSAAYSCNFAVARLTSSGALDTTFSGDGKQITDFGGDETAAAVAVQSDGRIVVAGEKYNGSVFVFAVARYNISGTLDTTFSGDGRQTVTVGATAWAESLLVQGDGKIVVAGTRRATLSSPADFAIARLNPGGALDTTFSSDGKAAVDFGSNDLAFAVARQPDGKYVLAGYAAPLSKSDFALARILP